jgi:hypothetical protein
MASDKQKDQSYFLAEVSGAALQRCIFPVGELKKVWFRFINCFSCSIHRLFFFFFCSLKFENWQSS